MNHTPPSNNSIINILKDISYPGFSRDIVSFGLINDVKINSNTIEIYLKINTDNNNHIDTLKLSIKNKINSKYSNFKVDIIINQNKPQISKMQTTNTEKIKNIIAVASGKGGVGKSTISLNLAVQLSKKYNVGLLDLDIYGPSLPMLVNLNDQPALNKQKKLVPLEKYNLKLMSFGFLNTNNSPAIWRGPMVARMTQQFFDDVVWGSLDYLILDLPPGTGDIQLTLVQKLALTGALIVTTPQNLALLDVKKGADMFSKVNTPVLGVIENMGNFICPHCNKESEIFKGLGGTLESNRLNVPLLAQIPLNGDIVSTSDNGTPFVLEYPESPIALEYDKIIKKLENI